MANRPIVITGSIAIDRLMSFKGKYSDYLIPEKLDVISISVFLDKLTQSNGGVGANIAYTLALLGEKPFLLGSVGEDGKGYMQKLSDIGVNTDFVHFSQTATASFNVITDSDQNQVSGFFPGAMFDSEKLSMEPWKDNNPIIIISPHDPKSMRRQIAECRKWNLQFCYDIGQQVSNTPAEYMHEGLQSAEVLITNEYELEVLSKKVELSVSEIKSIVPVVITTLGSRGSIIAGRAIDKPIHANSVMPIRVADPTGAGDSFRAGFLYGYARGWLHKTSAQLGSVCGTYAIENDSTQGHSFSIDEVSRRYKKSFGEDLPA